MGRLKAWSLGSRTRYALVWGGINAASLCSIMLLSRFPAISAGRVLAYFALALVVNGSVQALIGYRLAQRKLTTRRVI